MSTPAFILILAFVALVFFLISMFFEMAYARGVSDGMLLIHRYYDGKTQKKSARKTAEVVDNFPGNIAQIQNQEK